MYWANIPIFCLVPNMSFLASYWTQDPNQEHTVYWLWCFLFVFIYNIHVALLPSLPSFPLHGINLWMSCCCCCWVASVVPNSVQPHRRQPTRLRSPWDSPGKNTGVGCHFLLQCMKVKSESEVAQPCQTLCNRMDCGLPGSSVHGIFQARVLEWVAIAFSSLLPLPAFSLVYSPTYPLWAFKNI